MATAPTANRMSPGARSQRRSWSSGAARNSLLRAHQVPCSMAADVCSTPEAVHAEQRGVGVERGQVEALHVVEGDRRLMRKPNRPAPTRFQNATATKNSTGQR